MQPEIFSNIEATILSLFNQGFNTLEKLRDNSSFNEYTLNNTLISLIQKNILKFDKETKSYVYDTPVIGDKIILEGNIMLPVTVIRTADRTTVIRGQWYKFDADFDLRRIIWNIKTPEGKSTSIIDMIQNAVFKEKKSKILQAEHLKHIQKKIVPYNPAIKLFLNTVGEELADVDIIFVMKIAMNAEMNLDSKEGIIDFKGFRVKSLIDTPQLLNEITAANDVRNYDNVVLNRVFNFSDFIYLHNEIPVSKTKDKIHYVKITGIRNKLELTFYELNNTGTSTKTSTEEFLDVKEGIEYLKTIFDNFAKDFLMSAGFLVNLS